MKEIKKFPITIKEIYLDAYGHVNNAMYLTLLEDARWDFLTSHGYGFEKVMETGYGPVILDLSIRFLKELRLREEIIIETSVLSYKKKIGKMYQRMMRGCEVCCTAEITIGLFDLENRKLVLPTPEWLKACDIETKT